MKLGVMQPYLFPYLGYFQLINYVDTFVIFDDVNYIKRGFINSNNLLFGGNSLSFTMPLSKASSRRLINETKILANSDFKTKFLKTIECCYKRAPLYKVIYDILERVINNDELDLTAFIINSLKEIAIYLDINTRFLVSSEIEKDQELKGQDKIIEIAKVLGANNYINPIGGIEIYQREAFLGNGINLQFLKIDNINYNQFMGDFIPNLSIIDVLMFNDKLQVKELLNKFYLID